LKRNITMVGTIRKNKPELPLALLPTKGRELFSSKFAFTSTTTVVSYVPKRNRNVILLSTKHAEAKVSGDRRDKKPDIILDYNVHKGGVDNLDKVIGTYSCRRMTARWPLVILHNIIDVSSYNAFVIWREKNPEWLRQKLNRRRVFLEQLGKALVTPLIERRKRLPQTDASAAVVVQIQRAISKQSQSFLDREREVDGGTAMRTEAAGGGGQEEEEEEAAAAAEGRNEAKKRKRCQFCPRAKDNKTYTVCCGCKKFICKSCAFPYCTACANAEKFLEG